MAIDTQTKNRVLELYFPENLEDRISVKRTITKLEEENKAGANWKTPCARTIFKWIKDAKERITKEMDLNWQPWNMLLSDKAGIPFDPILLRLLKLWFRRQLKRGEKLPFVPFSVGIAKWAVRLHKIAPFLAEKELLYRARQYFAMERMAALKAKLPDSGYDDLEIAMKNESDQELRAAYEDFLGSRIIEIEGKEIQTGDDALSEIAVPENIAERIISKKTKRGKSK